MHKLKAKQEGQTRTKHQTQNQEKDCKINSIQGTWTCVFQSGRASTVGSAERTSHSKPRASAFALSQMKSWTQMKPWTQMKSWTQMNSILRTSKRKLESFKFQVSWHPPTWSACNWWSLEVLTRGCKWPEALQLACPEMRLLSIKWTQKNGNQVNSQKKTLNQINSMKGQATP